MALEQSISQLVASANALTDTVFNKQAQVDQKVSAAVNAVPNLESQVWLDQINGSDTNEGTEASPFKTFSKALSVGKVGGLQTIKVIGDLNLTDDTYTTAKRTHVHIESAARKADGSNYSIKPAIVEIANAAGTYRMTTISSIYSQLSISTNYFNIDFPVNTNSRTLLTEYLFYSRGLGNLNVHFSMYNGSILAAGRVGRFTGARGLRTVAIYLYNTTYVTADMAGKWIDGVAAAKLPSDYVDVFSNLASL